MTFIGAAVRGPRKVFEWNRTDASQFEATFSSGGGSPTPSITTAAVTERGLALAPSHTGTTAIQSIFLAKDPIPFSDDRRDMRFEMELFDVTGTSPTYVGFCVLADLTGTLSALCHFPFGPVSWAVGVQAGSVFTAPDNGVGVGLSGYAALELRGQKALASVPEISVFCQGSGVDAAAAGSVPNLAERRTGQTANVYSANRFTFDLALTPAAWTGRVCNRWGIAIRGDADIAPRIGNVKAYLL